MSLIEIAISVQGSKKPHHAAETRQGKFYHKRIQHFVKTLQCKSIRITRQFADVDEILTGRGKLFRDMINLLHLL
jgi:hypothetical protein